MDGKKAFSRKGINLRYVFSKLIMRRHYYQRMERANERGKAPSYDHIILGY